MADFARITPLEACNGHWSVKPAGIRLCETLMRRRTGSFPEENEQGNDRNEKAVFTFPRLARVKVNLHFD